MNEADLHKADLINRDNLAKEALRSIMQLDSVVNAAESIELFIDSLSLSTQENLAAISFVTSRMIAALPADVQDGASDVIADMVSIGRSL